MPFQTGDTCVDTALQANQYQASLNDGTLVQIGTAQYLTSVISTTATAIQYRFTNVSSTSVINKTITPTPQPCTLIYGADAISLAWGCAGIVLLGGIAKLLRSAIPKTDQTE